MYTLETSQKIPASQADVWDFISSPVNLKYITPAYMGFDITSRNLPDKMYPGMIITYKVSPLFNFKMDWVTEITHVADQQYFVDEQRIGPYSIWHHQHHLKSIAGGVEMNDIVSYLPPFGPLGSVANTLFIRKKLKEIFDFRTAAIEKKFGKY
jgi:ligand-binding SRPBCC domain-containing protein